MIRIVWFAVFLLAVIAPNAVGQVEEVRVRGWDPLVLDLKGDRVAATVQGRLLAHEAAHTVQQGRAQGPTPLAGSIRTARASVATPGTSQLELEVSAGSMTGRSRGGEPLGGVEVILKKMDDPRAGEQKTARTSGDGRFSFSDVTPGGYEMSWTAAGQREYQQIWIEELSNLRENGLQAACRRKCAAEHTNSQGALNLDAYGACMRECQSGAAFCPAPADPTR